MRWLRQGFSVTGSKRRQFSGIVRRVVTAPDDMHVGTKQDQISLVDRSCRFARNMHHAKRSRPPTKCHFQSRRFVSTIYAKQGVTNVRNSILDRCTIIQPNMWQPGSWPTGRLVMPEQMLRTARNIVDDGRVDIAIAEFGANHLVDLALLDVSNVGKIVADRSTCRAVVSDFRAPLRAPFAIAERGVTRRPDVPFTHLAPLDLVGVQQFRAAPPFERGCQLP